MNRQEIIQELIEARQEAEIETLDIAKNMSISKYDDLFINHLDTAVKLFETQKRDNNRCGFKDYVPALHMAMREDKDMSAEHRKLIVKALVESQKQAKVVRMPATYIRG